VVSTWMSDGDTASVCMYQYVCIRSQMARLSSTDQFRQTHQQRVSPCVSSFNPFPFHVVSDTTLVLRASLTAL
jgi:hypothetical protein